MARRFSSLFVALIVVVISGVAVAETYTLTGENTKIEFTGTKKGGSHTGGFKALTGTATVKETDPTSLTVNVSIDVNSMYTDADRLTNHLKSADFFEARKFPKADFKSSAVTKTATGYELTGDLTMHGKTAKVTLPAEITVTATGVKLTSSGSIDRTQWGIVYGKGMVDDKVSLKINLTAGK